MNIINAIVLHLEMDNSPALGKKRKRNNNKKK